MTLIHATRLIKSCAEKMNAHFKDTVFDEWAVIHLRQTRGLLLAYLGPRKQGFQQNFLKDAGSLRAALFTRDYDPGDFEFAHDGVGTGFEAFTVLGNGLYLIFNNTARSMDGIAQDPRWLGAQVPFVELSDQFREDPVVVAS